MSIINELKQEHKILGEKLVEIKTRGPASEEGRQILLSIKDALLSHLSKEDKNLYPVLNEAAKNNDILRSMLGTFDANMKNIAGAAMTFFKKCEQPVANPKEFESEFEFITRTLGVRIRQEESILYKEFERIVG